MSGRRLFFAALLAAGAAAFFLAVLRKRPDFSHTPYERPKGGEKAGEFELFIGS